MTGGYGFTEVILPTLLHPSNSVDIARDYFIRGYQGQHIDLPPDADTSPTGNLTDTQKQTLHYHVTLAYRWPIFLQALGKM